MDTIGTTIDRVECRPLPGVFWLGVVLLTLSVGITALCGYLSFSGTTQLSLGIIGLGAAELLCCFAGGLYHLLYALRARIIGDADGLRWRDVRLEWRGVTWAQVSDYYLEEHTRFARSKSEMPVLPTPTVVTASGILTIHNDLTGSDDLRRMIQERATAARVGEWQPLGTRRVDDWPQTFRYWTPESGKRFAWGMAASVAVYAVIGYGFLCVGTWVATVPDDISHRYITQSVIGAAYLALLAMPVSRLWNHYRAWKRRGERITATPETVRYENDATGLVRETAWHDVADYFYRPARGGLSARYALTLPGADEAEIVWDDSLMNGKHLLAIVQTYAPKPATISGKDGWRDKSVHEKTGGSDPATWQSGAVGVGGRVFSCRSPLAFLGAGLMTGTLALMLAAFLSAHAQGTPDKILFAALTVIFGLPAIWGAVCLAVNSRVETDDFGITQVTPFGIRRLPWFAVADTICTAGRVYLTVIGQNGTRLHFFSTLNGYAELRAEIERHTPKIVSCNRAEIPGVR